MAQTLIESTFKDSLKMCMGEIITTMQNMAMTQDKVNENLIKAIAGIFKSPLEKLRQKATETPKAIKTLMSKPFSGKENKFKKVRKCFLLLEVYFEAQAITLDSEKVRVAQSFLRDHALRWWGTFKKKTQK